jgi:hypothetical protein
MLELALNFLATQAQLEDSTSRLPVNRFSIKHATGHVHHTIISTGTANMACPRFMFGWVLFKFVCALRSQELCAKTRLIKWNLRCQ